MSTPPKELRRLRIRIGLAALAIGIMLASITIYLCCYGHSLRPVGSLALLSVAALYGGGRLTWFGFHTPGSGGEPAAAVDGPASRR